MSNHFIDFLSDSETNIYTLLRRTVSTKTLIYVKNTFTTPKCLIKVAAHLLHVKWHVGNMGIVSKCWNTTALRSHYNTRSTENLDHTSVLSFGSKLVTFVRSHFST
jgi:hypothetical protein